LGGWAKGGGDLKKVRPHKPTDPKRVFGVTNIEGGAQNNTIKKGLIQKNRDNRGKQTHSPKPPPRPPKSGGGGGKKG